MTEDTVIGTERRARDALFLAGSASTGRKERRAGLSRCVYEPGNTGVPYAGPGNGRESRAARFGLSSALSAKFENSQNRNSAIPLFLPSS